MSQYPWNEKNNTFTWLSSFYNPFKDSKLSLKVVKHGSCKKEPMAISNNCAPKNKTLDTALHQQAFSWRNRQEGIKKPTKNILGR